MQEITAKLTVFFGDPFWVGIYERTHLGRLSVCKITFYSEPKDYEVYAFLLEQWCKLRFSPPVRATRTSHTNPSPKRMQRIAAKEMGRKGTGTKSQQALQLQHEQSKETKKAANKLQKRQEQQMKFERKQEKRKEKHKGH